MTGGSGDERAAAALPNGPWQPWRRWLAILLALAFVALAAYDVIVPGAEVPTIVYVVLGSVIGAVFPTGLSTLVEMLQAIGEAVAPRKRS